MARAHAAALIWVVAATGAIAGQTLEDFACTPSTSGEPVTCNVTWSIDSAWEVCLFAPSGTRDRCCLSLGGSSCDVDGFTEPGTWTVELRGDGQPLDAGALAALGFTGTVEVLLVEDQDGDGTGQQLGDCDDQNPHVYSGAPEQCDGINNDCLDPAWPAASALERDVDLDLLTACAGDCNDEDPAVSSASPEICDTFDNDCDGEIDELAECLRTCEAPDLVYAADVDLPSWGVRTLTPTGAAWNGETLEVISQTYGEDTNEYPEEVVDEHVYMRVDADGQRVDSGFLGDTVVGIGALIDPGVTTWTGSRFIRTWARKWDDVGGFYAEFLGRELLAPPASYRVAWSGTDRAVVWWYFGAQFAHGRSAEDARLLPNVTGPPSGLFWTGDAFALFWQAGGQHWGVLLDGSGQPLGPNVPVPGTPDLWTGDAFVVTRVEGGEIPLSRLDASLVSLMPPVPLTQGPYASISWHMVAWTGSELGLVWKAARTPGDRETVHFARFAADGTRLIDDHPFAYRDVPHDPVALQWTGQRYVLLLYDGRQGDAWLIRCDCDEDADVDAVPACSDCADDAPTVFPGAPQRCNGINDDCNDFLYPDPYPGETPDAVGSCEGLCGATVEQTFPDPFNIDTFVAREPDVHGDHAVVALNVYNFFTASTTPSVEIYDRDGGTWSLAAELDRPTHSRGYAHVAIDETTVVIGWPGDNGDVAIHDENAGGTAQWGVVRRIDTAAADNHERLVDVSVDTVAVASEAAVFVHERDLGGPDRWGLATTIERTGRSIRSLALDGDTLAFGELERIEGQTVRRVTVYRRVAGSWTEAATLEGSDSPSDYGDSIAIAGDRLAIRAGDGVHVHGHDVEGAGLWGELAHLAENYGDRVDLDGDRLLTGAQIYVMTDGPQEDWRRVRIPLDGLALGGDSVWAPSGILQAHEWADGFEDHDADAFGDDATHFRRCGDLTGFVGYANTGGDCDDADARIFPGAIEVCDGVNNDCLDPLWPAPRDEADVDGDRISLCDGDCDDTDFTTGPGATEACDGRDNDCDQSVDEGQPGAERVLETFDGQSPGEDPPGWLDTGAGNSLEPDDVFEVMDVDGERVFGTTLTANHVHSHFDGAGSADWTDYTFSGRFRIDDPAGGIGFSVLSDYPNSNSYYYLRRLDNDPELRVRTHGIDFPDCTPRDTGVDPADGAWYRFEVLAEVDGAATIIRASAWRDGEPPPADWQVTCVDAGAERRTAGTFGLWGFGPGAKYYDDLRVVAQSGQVCGSDVGACTSGVDYCEAGELRCSGAGPTPEACNAIDDDCDGQLPADELDLDGDDWLACTSALTSPTVTMPGVDLATWDGDVRDDGWNLYIGDLAELKLTGRYSQAPGSNVLADRVCGRLVPSAAVDALPESGAVAFLLVTSVEDAVEGGLGTDGTGRPRPHDAPCP